MWPDIAETLPELSSGEGEGIALRWLEMISVLDVMSVTPNHLVPA